MAQQRIEEEARKRDRDGGIYVGTSISERRSDLVYEQHTDGMNEYFERALSITQPVISVIAPQSQPQRDSAPGNQENDDASLQTLAQEGKFGRQSIRKKLKKLTFHKPRHHPKSQSPKTAGGHKKRKPWKFKLNCTFGGMTSESPTVETPTCSPCVCTGYKRTEDPHLGPGVVFDSNGDPVPPHPVIDLSKFNPDDYPIEDCDERARAERAREIAEGVEPPPGYHLVPAGSSHVAAAFNPSFSTETHLVSFLSQLNGDGMLFQRTVHTQVDYIHCLVPDLLEITNCSCYWGKMDRYEAESLLENKPEGTFLLRDSAQEEYLFSVSFRRYGRSLHARIEQWNHMFSFDSHDPGVFASSTVCGLIEHYKDPSCCMFFEPMLTIPLRRNHVFSLQHLCRSVITKRVTYDGINQLRLPKMLKSFLKEYHYKQRVRVRRFEVEH
ncbi:unnamed protein product [Darwinula stevensoni]|uniref:Suppressor of cytokine signaling 5 n=1 Tax=Darwinula stevensoni TaxID=69355 RepID=A0A7R8X8H0_9CRUS|nr:unnamed protein product [Darwinula stevensoni]CAG0884456.1 unnamed protein product [Darwinula stevensoni]